MQLFEISANKWWPFNYTVLINTSQINKQRAVCSNSCFEDYHAHATIKQKYTRLLTSRVRSVKILETQQNFRIQKRRKCAIECNLCTLAPAKSTKKIQKTTFTHTHIATHMIRLALSLSTSVCTSMHTLCVGAFYERYTANVATRCICMDICMSVCKTCHRQSQRRTVAIGVCTKSSSIQMCYIKQQQQASLLATRPMRWGGSVVFLCCKLAAVKLFRLSFAKNFPGDWFLCVLVHFWVALNAQRYRATHTHAQSKNICFIL